MVSLTDRQLAAVMDAARTLPVERRDTFLQRVGAMLKMRGRFSNQRGQIVGTFVLGSYRLSLDLNAGGGRNLGPRDAKAQAALAAPAQIIVSLVEGPQDQLLDVNRVVSALWTLCV